MLPPNTLKYLFFCLLLFHGFKPHICIRAMDLALTFEYGYLVMHVLFLEKNSAEILNIWAISYNFFITLFYT